MGIRTNNNVKIVKKNTVNKTNKKFIQLPPLSKNFVDFKQFPFVRTIDTGSDVFIDDAICIPLFTDAKELDDFSKNTFGEDFTDLKFPYFSIEHEEEYYGHDTHGWNVYYEDGSGSLIYVCSKKLNKEVALRKAKEYFDRNYDVIAKDFKRTQK